MTAPLSRDELVKEIGNACELLIKAGGSHGTVYPLLRQAAAMLREDATYHQFFSKPALGGLALPSCLVCGQQKLAAITHQELPEIVVCVDCHAAKHLLAELEAQLLTALRQRNDECALRQSTEKAYVRERDKATELEARCKRLEGALRGLLADLDAKQDISDSVGEAIDVLGEAQP